MVTLKRIIYRNNHKFITTYEQMCVHVLVYVPCNCCNKSRNVKDSILIIFTGYARCNYKMINNEIFVIEYSNAIIFAAINWNNSSNPFQRRRHNAEGCSRRKFTKKRTLLINCNYKSRKWLLWSWKITSLSMAQLSLSLCTLSLSTETRPTLSSMFPVAIPTLSNLPETRKKLFDFFLNTCYYTVSLSA